MEAGLNKFQEFLYSLDVTYEGPDYDNKAGLVLTPGMRLSRKICRHYRDSLNNPLRFYGAWQQVPSSLRQFIRINSQETIELDFKCCQPVLLFNLAGLDCWNEFPLGDTYTIAQYTLKIEREEERHDFRQFLKLVFARLCFDTQHTPDQILHGLEPDISDYEESLSYGAPENANNPTLGVVAKVVGKPVRDAVNDVVREYCSRFDVIPRKLMDWELLEREESRITEEILATCMEKNIPVLPIHDGYRTISIYHFQLRLIMVESYRKITGQSNCDIKEES